MIKVWKSELECEPYISPIGAGDLVDIFNYDGAFIEGYFITAQELEDRERRAFESAWNKRSDWSDPHYQHPGADDFERAFNDYNKEQD